MNEGKVRERPKKGRLETLSFVSVTTTSHPKIRSMMLIGNFSTTCPTVPTTYCFLFLHLKKRLDGRRFEDDRELNTAVVDWLNSPVENFYTEGLRKPLQRSEKCSKVNGSHVEKSNMVFGN